MTKDANFENILFCPNSTFNIRKSHKISGGKALYLETISQKSHGEWRPPPKYPLGSRDNQRLNFSQCKLQHWIDSVTFYPRRSVTYSVMSSGLVKAIGKFEILVGH